MPFVQRVVAPIYISRKKKTPTTPTVTPVHTAASTEDYQQPSCSTTIELTNKSAARNEINDHEFEAVSNLTLSNALRQLASLVLIANDIFTELNSELQNVGQRARGIKVRIDKLTTVVDEFDPKLVAVRKYRQFFLFL